MSLTFSSRLLVRTVQLSNVMNKPYQPILLHWDSRRFIEILLILVHFHSLPILPRVQLTVQHIKDWKVIVFSILRSRCLIPLTSVLSIPMEGWNLQCKLTFTSTKMMMYQWLDQLRVPKDRVHVHLSLSLCTEYLHQVERAGQTPVVIWRSLWMLKCETSMDNWHPLQRHAVAPRGRKANGRRKLNLVSTVESWSCIIIWISSFLRQNIWWCSIGIQRQCLRCQRWFRELHGYIRVRPWSYKPWGAPPINILCILYSNDVVDCRYPSLEDCPR